MKAKTFKIVCFSCAAVLLALIIILSVVMSMFSGILSLLFGGKELDAATREAGETLATQIEEEGIVLVKNDDCLPLSEDDVTTDGEQKVNVFGWAATDWLAGGSGSGRVVDGNNGNSKAPGTDLLKALTGYTVFSDDGIKYNTELTNMYTSFKNKRNSASTDTLNSHDYDSCVLWEPSVNDVNYYSSALMNNAEGYSDVAIVVLGRIAGESNDAPLTQYRYNKKNGTKIEDKERTYLDISPEEEELLTYAGENYDKTIVIINSTNTMNLEFMDRIDGLDACLIAGGTGVNAANAIPNILFGQKKVDITDDDGNVADTKIVKVSPSGKTVDTYAYDFATNASYAYTGMDGVSQYDGASNKTYPLTTTNPNVGSGDKYPGVSYLDYVEGIYVGYKWYETADTEGFWKNVSNDYGKGYDGVVQYPFGYGLSYTTFDWKAAVWSEKDGVITVEVSVENTGDYPAQETVELYYDPPYTKGGLEKASVNLCAFNKAVVAIEPGETQVLTLSVNVQDMASYDQNANSGKGAYVLEKGDYTLSLRTDSHTIANVKSGGATYKYNTSKDVTYTTYAGSNGTEEIHNLFIGTDNSDGVAIDGSDSNQEIEWLTRQNFSSSFQSEKATARKWQSALDASNLYTAAAVTAWDTAWQEENSGVNYQQGQNNGYTLYSNNNYTDSAYFFGNPDNFDDPEWNRLLDQLTTNEMRTLVLHGYIHEEAIASIGKPRTTSVDGPAQIGSFNVNNPGVGYPMPTVLAQTWNSQLSKSFGLAVGTEALGSGRNGWYAPGVNLHRSAFGGRNYEYYSEDSYLSGVMCTETVQGALNAGVYTYIKHFIGYDQESMRDGLYCWMTEQTLREVYLKPFKMAVDGGASGLMTSYGRLGAVWSGGSESLLTDLIRNEWGFKGTVITDYSDHQDFMNGDQMLRAGGDLWMDGYGNNGAFRKDTSSAAFNACLRTAAKHIIYTWANAAYQAREYQNSGDDVIPVERATGGAFAWWWLIVGILDGAFAIGAGVLIFLAIKKKDPEAEAVATTSSVQSSEPEKPEDTPANE